MKGWGGSSVVEYVFISIYKVLGSIPELPPKKQKQKNTKQKPSKSFNIKSTFPPSRKGGKNLPSKRGNNLRKAIVLVSLFTPN